MLSKNMETFLCCDKEWEEAGTVLFGAPFDSTTSYRPGSRFGSSAIRRETQPCLWHRSRSGPPPFWRRASVPSCWGASIW